MTDCGISLVDFRITDLGFTDDVVSFAETLEVFVHALDGNVDLPPLVTVQGEHASFVDNFLYLRRVIGSLGRSFLEINRRQRIASAVMNS